MNNYRYTLEKFKGRNTRFICPECKDPVKSFVLYIDTHTGLSINPKVGRCNREGKCGYHYPPREYFSDNHISIDTNIQMHHFIKPFMPTLSSFISIDTMKESLQNYNHNTFIGFLSKLFGNDITTGLIVKYFIGTSGYWNGATLFWQIDITGRIRTGKIIQFEIIPLNHSCIDLDCKRNKKNVPPVQWVHSVTKQQDFQLKQCLFGEHLLKDSSIPVAIVESEKTAIISSIYFPQFTWLATGGLSNLTIDMCRVLKDRTITLFPDVNGFEKWSIKMTEISQLMPGTSFKISRLFEKNATGNERLAGCDLADYLIKFEPKLFNTNLHHLYV